MKLPQYFKQTLAICFTALFAAFAHADGVNEPIPSFYQEPGLSPNRGYVSQHANEHIDPFTGKLQWHFVDLYIPGNGGMDIKVQRSYSSLNEILGDDSPFGAGWTMHYGRVLRKASVSFCAHALSTTLAPVFEMPDGSRQIFYDTLDNVDFISTGMWKAKCNGAGYLDVYSPDGTKYEMTTAGPLIGTDPNRQNALYTTRITDRNGNVLNVTYDSTLGGTVLAVKTISSAADGRKVTFNYAPAVPNASSALSSITDGTRTWTYKLTPISGVIGRHFFLNEVVRPDGASWKFDYNLAATGPGQGAAGGYSLKKVTYPTGGAIDYTYGFIKFDPGNLSSLFLPPSTVIKTKLADSATWTYEYTPSTEAAPVGEILFDPDAPSPGFDRTKVTGPEGERLYLHYGYNSITNGAATWALGLIAASAIRTVFGADKSYSQFEGNYWGRVKISNQTYQRPGTALYDDAVYMPLLQRKNVSRNGQTFTTVFSNFDVYSNAQTIVETGTDTRTTTLTYYTDPAKWIIRVKKDEAVSTIPGSITRAFDANANLSVETRYGVPATYTYTAEGDLATKKDARDKITTYSSYKRGIPQLESHPEAVTISRTVSDDGNVLTETDGEGAKTIYTYDGLNRVKTITHPIGNQVTVDWLTSPALSTRTVKRGNYREVVTYDSFGREIRNTHTDVSDPNSVPITQTHQYDAISRKIFSSYPNSNLGTGYVHDLVGQPRYVYHEYNQATKTYKDSRTYSYLINVVELSNERGKKFVNTYRFYGSPGDGQLMKIEAPEPDASVIMTRNGLGQLLTVKQDNLSVPTQNAVTRTFTYFPNYYLETMTEPEVGTTTYGRDAVGNMISRKVSTSALTTFGYDDLNRLTTITYPIGAPVGTPNVTKTYYKDGQPKSTNNGVALREYLYDANKNKTKETLTVGTQVFVTQYDYDANDALALLTYGSGQKVSYAPDAFGRPTKAAPYVTAATHHPNGQLASFTYANGLKTTVELNERQWPKALKTPAISNLTYGYDGLGNVYSIEDTVEPKRNRAMGYDGIDRLTVANGATWGNGTISYDGRGNIKSQLLGTASPALTYTYDSATNRLASVSGRATRTFSYDVYGNVSGNGLNTFAYNDALNMRCANCGLANEVTYDYDGDNMRVRSTKGGVATYYVYGLDGKLLWERVPGVSLKENIYLNGKQVAERAKTGN
jgi:YD repeat-containing protein